MKKRFVELLIHIINGLGLLASVVVFPVGIVLFTVCAITVYPVVYIIKNKELAETILLFCLLPVTIPLWLLSEYLEKRYL